MSTIVFLLAAGEILTKLTTTREKVLVERKIFVTLCDPSGDNEDRGQRWPQSSRRGIMSPTITSNHINCPLLFERSEENFSLYCFSKIICLPDAFHENSKLKGSLMGF